VPTAAAEWDDPRPTQDRRGAGAEVLPPGREVVPADAARQWAAYQLAAYQGAAFQLAAYQGARHVVQGWAWDDHLR
jgi:hypothetical protein